ncbi:hypothetical protein [Microbacterium sp. NPDC056052]|uniref:hypothetical protein n=1 Tax=Microbacterium sp. NPDC056052 TaxID=3345695 RepID=UPI0035D6C34F
MVTDYTPTTEEVRSAWVHGSRVMPAYYATDYQQAHTGRLEEIDRWMAAHDAEVRASALAEREPEWEYRWARADGEHAWPFGAGDSEDGETLDGVKAAPARDPEPEYFDGAHIERRTKAVSAGPWEPVEENTPHTEGNER